jgi:3-dehydroquinate synthase
MVDSSIGGKTAINLPEGKNLVGTFTQPAQVICNLDVLATLPAREWLCGMAEVAKSALLDSEDFVQLLKGSAGSADVRELVLRSLDFKARIVGQDELEHGVRECLNYGHTLAHALETAAGYGVLSHGQAVAEGMRFAAELGRSVVGVSERFITRQAALLDSLGLTKLNLGLDLGLDPQKLLDIMAADKKVRAGVVRFIFVTAPGVWQSAAVSNEALRLELKQFVA